MSDKYFELRKALPQKPSYKEMIEILRTVVEDRVKNVDALAELGFSCNHIQYLMKSLMLPSGGDFQNRRFEYELIEGTYSYFLEEENKKSWELLSE